MNLPDVTQRKLEWLFQLGSYSEQTRQTQAQLHQAAEGEDLLQLAYALRDFKAAFSKNIHGRPIPEAKSPVARIVDELMQSVWGIIYADATDHWLEVTRLYFDDIAAQRAEFLPPKRTKIVLEKVMRSKIIVDDHAPTKMSRKRKTGIDK